MTSNQITRVMLDTNILFSAMYKPNGTPFEAFRKTSELPYRLVLCDQIIDELRRNFNRKFPAKIPALERFLSIAHYDLVTLAPEDEAAPDEESINDSKDRPILRAARKAKVDIFVTGDNGILESLISSPRIMRATEFVNLVN